MKKKELLQLPELRATTQMMRLATGDKLMWRKTTYFVQSSACWGYEWGAYLRCKVFGEILKVAIFLPEYMRIGTRNAAFEVFVDRENSSFLTYDHQSKCWLTAKVDRLPWPQYVYYSEKKWVSEHDENTIQAYLGGGYGGYAGLLHYQRGIREAELERRCKRETDAWDADLEKVPKKPKDFDRWCAKVGIPENYIFYHYQKRGVKTGYCTYCEQDVPISKPRHNQPGRCPHCRRNIIYKADGKASRVSTSMVYMHLIQRCHDGFVTRQFSGYRIYRMEDYRNPELHVHENCRVIYDRDTMEGRPYHWGKYRNRETRWTPRDRLCGVSRWNGYWYTTWEGKVYGKTLPALAKSVLMYTGLPEAIRLLDQLDPELYLTRLKENPILEQLAKAGLGGMVLECVKNHVNLRELKMLPGAGLAKTLGIDAQEMRRLREGRGGYAFLNWLRYEKSTGKEIANHVISWFCKQKIQPNDLDFINDRMSPLQIYNYLNRQMRELNMESSRVITIWADYLSMAKRLKMDLNKEAVYRVKHVKKRHDELLNFFHQDANLAIEAGKILMRYPHLEEIMQEIKDKYQFADDSYSILVPERVEDIIIEGQILSHCVGDSERYWERMERRESYVLFLRRTGEQDKPYYTLEIEPDGTVRQKRSLNDEQHEDIEDAARFLRNWQKDIRKRLTPEDLKLAEESKTLRLQEFEELREKQVKVRAGKFAGASLLDILQRDLMEAA